MFNWFLPNRESLFDRDQPNRLLKSGSVGLRRTESSLFDWPTLNMKSLFGIEQPNRELSFGSFWPNSYISDISYSFLNINQ